MSRRLFSVPSFTPTATADTSALANATYMALGAGSATTALGVTEIFVQGLGTSSTNVNNNVFARVSTLATTPTALAAPASDGPMPGGLASALTTVPLSYTAAAAGPQRSALTTAARLMLSVNALGGVARWKPADLSETWWIMGVTVNISESNLSASTAAGTTSAAQAASIMYEPLALWGVMLLGGLLAAAAGLHSHVSALIA